MELNNGMKDTLIQNIINSTNLIKERDEIIKQEKELVEAIVEQDIYDKCKEFKELTKNAPKEWFYLLYQVHIKENSAMGIIHDICHTWLSITPMPIPKIYNHIQFKNSPMHDEAVKWRKKYIELKKQLTEVIYPYNTVKKLITDHPDFQKYLPETARKTYPVAVNSTKLYANLKQLGFGNDNNK